MHSALGPLRCAVYRRLGLSPVKEVLCSALVGSHAWVAETPREIGGDVAAAAAPLGDAAQARQELRARSLRKRSTG